jgi:hypothetical protein
MVMAALSGALARLRLGQFRAGPAGLHCGVERVFTQHRMQVERLARLVLPRHHVSGLDSANDPALAAQYLAMSQFVTLSPQMAPPELHAPAPSQLSPTVHKSPSSQAVFTASGLCVHTPVPALQASTVLGWRRPSAPTRLGCACVGESLRCRGAWRRRW